MVQGLPLLAGQSEKWACWRRTAYRIPNPFLTVLLYYLIFARPSNFRMRTTYTFNYTIQSHFADFELSPHTHTIQIDPVFNLLWESEGVDNIFQVVHSKGLSLLINSQKLSVLYVKKFFHIIECSESDVASWCNVHIWPAHPTERQSKKPQLLFWNSDTHTMAALTIWPTQDYITRKMRLDSGNWFHTA